MTQKRAEASLSSPPRCGAPNIASCRHGYPLGFDLVHKHLGNTLLLSPLDQTPRWRWRWRWRWKCGPVCTTCVSLHTRRRSMQLIWVAERLGASSRRPRHPFPGRVPVHRALLRTKSTQHLSLNTTGMSTTRSKKRAANVGSRLSPKTAHELQDLHNPRRPPHQRTANGESQESEPWESASAPRQGCQSPQTMRTSGSESTFTEKLHENPKPQ